MTDRIGLSPTMAKATKGEIRRILGTLGAAASWLAGPQNRQIYFPSREIQIVLSSSPPSAWGLPDNVMGLVVPTASRPRREIIIFPLWLTQVLGPPYDERPPGQIEDLRFAHSLARIIAHEVVHAVAPEHPHATSGLMHGQQNRATLLNEGMAIDPVCAEAFRSGLDLFQSGLAGIHHQ